MKSESPRSAVRRIATTALFILSMAGAARTAQAVQIITDTINNNLNISSVAPALATGTIKITSSGAPLSFNVSARVSTPQSINWISIDRFSGTTPATVTVTANPLGLGVSYDYFATITIVSSGATNSPLIITVDYQAIANKVLAAAPTSIVFTASAGTRPAVQPVGITSEGPTGGELLYTAAISINNGGNWLSVSPATALTPRIMNVSADASSLAPGMYAGTIVITDTNPNNPPSVVPVTIVVTAASPPGISLAPASLTFASAPGTSPPTQTFQVTNGGTGTFNWTAAPSTTSGGNWLSINPASGSTPSTVTITVNSAALATGNYSGKITVSSAGIGNSPQVVNITLAIGTQPTISFSPGALFFSTTPGTNPALQNFQVTNSGVGVLGWSAATTAAGNWLGVSPVSGTAPSTLTATVNSAGFPQGNYNGKVTLTSPNASNSPQIIPALLTVSNNAPIANQNGVVNGGSFSLDAIVAPNTIASLFGGRMSDNLYTAQTLPLPPVLGTTQVFVNGVAAPLFFVSNTQINFQMPPEVTGNTALVNVLFNGATSAPITVNLAPAVPGIFTRNQQGTGAGAVLNADNSPNSPSNPASRGGTVVIFATGLGATNPPVAAGLPGNVAEPFNRLITTPQVTIGGIDAHVDFAAVAPGFVGEYQVNAVVPQNVAPGSAVNVQITAGGKSSNIATISVN